VGVALQKVPAQFDEWMRGTPDQAAQLMKPYAGAIEAWEVGAEVGNVRNNRPELIERVGLLQWLECISGCIDQLRLAHWLGDKGRLLQLHWQCITGIALAAAIRSVRRDTFAPS
jgi:hypothetical protein